MATADSKLIPALSSGGTLDAMQIEYWREHLRPHLPPLSEAQYQEIKHDLERFDMRRTFRKLISMELLIGVLSPQKKKYATEPIALIDPLTQELIPNGRWREAIGAAHVRSSITITAPTSAEHEQRLVPFVRSVNTQPFQALTHNCSDFVKCALLQVFADSGLRFRPRIFTIADAWITTPLEVATAFLNYARREEAPITVTLVPMLAGTRRPTAEITSISRGALIPSAAQGKLAFGMKVYFNTLNPLLGLTSYSVDKLSNFADLKQLVHERAGTQLSRLAYGIDRKVKPSDEDFQVWRREQVNVFGTSSCWNAKRDEFDKLTSQMYEAGILTAAERALLLKPGRPFLLPRLYERTAAEQAHPGVLIAGMQNRDLVPVGTFASSRSIKTVQEANVGSRPDGLVPGRPEIQDMAESGHSDQLILALKIMTSVINYDLSSQPTHRRTAEAFDQDWHSFLDIARKNGAHLLDEHLLRESVQVCSRREFDEGKADSDAFGEALRFWHGSIGQGQTILFGANR